MAYSNVKDLFLTALKKLLLVIPDSLYLKMVYRIKMGKKLNLRHPKSFNEKIQWLKLYDRNPFYTSLVDKIEVKKIVADTIGEKYVLPTLGVWERFDDIDFDALPNQFVLKTNHGGGSTGVVICKDKNEFDIEKARVKLEHSLRTDAYTSLREWPYKNVKRRIFAEPFVVDEATGELRDYKFFCFGGVPKALFVATDRQKNGEEVKFDFFDIEYNHLPIKQGHQNAQFTPEKPSCFDEMKKIAARLSEGIPQVRVDLYEANGNVIFGEMTFSHFGGVVPFQPDSWDNTFGSWINLPETKIR